jgi:hypothetical protein
MEFNIISMYVEASFHYPPGDSDIKGVVCNIQHIHYRVLEQ